jgi:hypothetical protein
MPTSASGYDLTDFGLREMLQCGMDIRAAARDASTFEEASQAIVRKLYGACRTRDGGNATALVRLYKTHDFGTLPRDLQAAGLGTAGVPVLPTTTRCLTLLATAGDRPEWNDRRRSVGHKCIPLSSERAVIAAPMIAQLVKSMGLEIHDVVKFTPDLIPRLSAKTYDVFFVERAPGSPFIPAQATFVQEYGIQSVIGFGGVLPNGQLVVAILFTKVPVTRSAAERFRTVAVDLKSALYRFPDTAIFAP